MVILGLMGLIITGFTKGDKHEISHCYKDNLFIFVGSLFCRILYQKQVYFLPVITDWAQFQDLRALFTVTKPYLKTNILVIFLCEIERS